MHRARRSLWAAGIFSLLAAMLPFVAAAPVLADTGATVPAGFQDEVVLTGLDHPMSIVFAPNGNVFVAEKRGVIKFYTSLADTSRQVFADLNTNVHNYWDRGLMGLAVDPGYPSRPYVYVLYAYNHILGDEPGPALAVADALVPPGSKYDDRCPNPPQGTADGCVISRAAVAPDRERRGDERQRGCPRRGLVPAVPKPLARQPGLRARRRPVRVGR